MTEPHFNPDKKRFELTVDGHTAIIDTILSNDNVMFLTHTEVPTALEGQGIGKKLVEFALNHIETNGFKLAPLCPFVAAYLKRHTEWARILAPGYNIG